MKINCISTVSESVLTAAPEQMDQSANVSAFVHAHVCTEC